MSASAFVNLADKDDGEGGNEDARKRPADVSSISSNSLLPSKFARGKPRRPRGSPPQRQQMKLCGRDLNDPIANQRMDIAVADFFHSNCLPFSLTRCPKFIKVIAEAKNVGTKYQTPDRNRMSGPLLDGLYESNYDEMMRTLLIDSRIFGISIFGDGATITNTPLINILAASPNNPSALLEIVDCTDQMASGGKKGASYLANLVRPCIGMIEAKANTSKQQNHQAVVDLVQFDGASSVQLSGRILASYYPRITVCHGAEHSIALFFKDLFEKVKSSLFFFTSTIGSPLNFNSQLPNPNYRLTNSRIYQPSARVAETYGDLYATDPMPCSNITRRSIIMGYF
jgi:hypothetical protein